MYLKMKQSVPRAGTRMKPETDYRAPPRQGLRADLRTGLRADLRADQRADQRTDLRTDLPAGQEYRRILFSGFVKRVLLRKECLTAEREVPDPDILPLIGRWNLLLPL